MPDREKVIRGLTVCSEFTPDCRECPYQGEEYCTDAVMRDAIELLKGQKAQWTWDRPHHFKCSACGAVFGVSIIMYGYCPHCGREMGLKEEERKKEWQDETD